jgi:hypothetical protein
MLLLMGVLIVGLGAGAGLMYVMNELRPVYQNTRVLAEATGLPVLGAVSRTWLPDERARERKGVFVFAGAASLLVAICLIFVMWSGPAVRVAQRLLASA